MKRNPCTHGTYSLVGETVIKQDQNGKQGRVLKAEEKNNQGKGVGGICVCCNCLLVYLLSESPTTVR